MLAGVHVKSEDESAVLRDETLSTTVQSTLSDQPLNIEVPSLVREFVQGRNLKNYGEESNTS